MTPHIPDELLSVYFDGEANETERTEMERHLESSPHARRQLDEIAILSDLVRSLPRETAPPEFASAVLRQAERSMLLPTPSISTSFRSRRHILAVAAGLTAAMGLFVMAWFVNGNRPQEMAESVRPLALTRNEGGLGALKEREQASTTAGRRPSSAVPNAVDLSRLKIGDVIPQFERAENQVSVVNVTVVDVEQAVGQVRVLLARNAIPAADEATSGKATSKGKSAGDTPQLVAVYAESPSDQLAAAISELREEHGFVKLELAPAVDAKQVAVAARNLAERDNTVSQSAVQTETLADAIQRARRAVPLPAESHAAAGPPRGGIEKKLSKPLVAGEPERSADESARLSGRKQVAPNSGELQAFQVLVNMPVAAFERTSVAAALGKQPAASGVHAQPADGPPPTEPKRLCVVFVFRSNAAEHAK